MTKAKTVSISVNAEFKASHSLEGFLTPHFHLFKIEAEFKTSLPFQNDRLIDLVYLKQVLDEVLAPMQNSYLNESRPNFQPTSENLAIYLWDELSQKLPDAPLSEVRVHLCDLEGKPSGTARVST